MRHEIDAYFEPDIAWLGEINRQTLRLEREAGVFPPQSTHLNCALSRGVEDRAGVTLTLRVGDHEMRSRAEDSSPVAATRRAFDELRRQLAGYTAERREEGFWARTSRNRGAQHEPVRRAAPETKRDAARVIDRHLSELYNFVRREIASRQALGDLKAGDLTPEEVLDEAAAHVLEGFDSHPAELDFSRWLLQLALDTVERRTREIGEERESLLRLEDDGRVATSAGRDAAEDEIYDYYQPDEEVRLEDLIADERVPTPEEALAGREFQQYINRTLSTLPRRWREAFVLYSVEGLTLEEVARVTGRPVDDARRAIEMAREYLRSRLVEAGAVTHSAGEAEREEVKAR